MPSSSNLPPAYRYTTEDEIEFVRRLERDGKRNQLRLYRKSLSHREWRGTGMEVDRERIELELNRILGKESEAEKKESYEELVTRVATEWLEGGRLRNVARRRAMADESEV